jgi:hypothetical protein
MIDPHHIESLLRINGLEKTAPDEQIRSVLLSARFKEDEVDTALMILRENTQTKQTRVDGLHKVFRTDEALRPDEISRLLGINVEIREPITPSPVSPNGSFTLVQFIVLWVASTILAVSAILFYMYSNQMGFFHEEVNTAQLNAT